jgi:hypothetical protein
MFYGILKDKPVNNPARELIAIFATPLSVTSEPPAVVAETINFKRHVMEQTAQRWVIESDLNPFDEPPDLMSHRLDNGETKTIFVQFPQPYSKSDLQGSSGVKLIAAATRRSTELLIAGTLIPNTFICIGETPGKIYLVTSFKPGSCTIFPSLRKDQPIDAPIYHGKDAIMLANYDSDFVRGMKYENGILATPGQIRLVEEV